MREKEITKRFVFVNPAINIAGSGLVNHGLVNHGIAFLAPIIKKYGYKVKVIYINEEISNERFINEIKDFNPSIIGFSITSHQIKYLKKYSDALKDLKHTLLIAGGVHPTLDPDGTLKQTSLMGVCIGEGEIPVENLLRNIKEKKNIFKTKGFYWKDKDKIIKNPVQQFIKDLSTIEFPSHSIFNLDQTRQQTDQLLMVFSRGCPYQCTYCCNKALSEVYLSNKNFFRIPPVEYCIKLLESVIKEYDIINSIWFEDENLIANKEWFLEFAEKYEKRIGLPYDLQGRIESLDREVVAALKNSGCKLLYVGLESGDEKLRLNLLNRKYSNELFIKKAKMVKKAGIKLHTYNIVGFPFESKKQMKETLRLNKIIKPNGGRCMFFYPYKKTKLYKICKENKLLKSEKEMSEMTNIFIGPAIKMTKKQEKACKLYYQKINSYFSRQRNGFIKYYFLRPIWELSAFFKSKSKLYESFVDLIKAI
jgi:radical SAM superfamily enzyme YgiQ (UPF0313 family)